ncbi:uncharacterized protein LOC120133158 isoform X3 [Hibiscus syriacus]|uniref:uncharacterized protein LOC120133158 isoform X3 n=1 Tax=Hibiscus syriacus TaxID=106335 RepID=UPI0019243396|nr:uncharacterized protein LOC120133158 isoform X3 [Hibiscus syriacus]
MLENPTPTPPDAAPAIKRYAPPNQRNRSVERRKSGDWFDSTNNVYGNDSEKIQGVVRNNNLVGDSGSSAILNEDHRRPGLIPLEGCSRSDASRLLSNQRPVVYSGSSDSAWRNFRLPHQMMSPTNTIRPSSNSQMDFLPDLHRVIQNANADN